MSIDEQIREIVRREIEPLRAEVDRLNVELELAKSGLRRPVYDYKALRELNYSHHESRRILRAYGHKRNGRYRVIADRLLEYQRGSD